MSLFDEQPVRELELSEKVRELNRVLQERRTLGHTNRYIDEFNNRVSYSPEEKDRIISETANYMIDPTLWVEAVTGIPEVDAFIKLYREASNENRKTCPPPPETEDGFATIVSLAFGGEPTPDGKNLTEVHSIIQQLFSDEAQKTYKKLRQLDSIRHAFVSYIINEFKSDSEQFRLSVDEHNHILFSLKYIHGSGPSGDVFGQKKFASLSRDHILCKALQKSKPQDKESIKNFYMILHNCLFFIDEIPKRYLVQCPIVSYKQEVIDKKLTFDHIPFEYDTLEFGVYILYQVLSELNNFEIAENLFDKLDHEGGRFLEYGPPDDFKRFVSFRDRNCNGCYYAKCTEAKICKKIEPIKCQVLSVPEISCSEHKPAERFKTKQE